MARREGTAGLQSGIAAHRQGNADLRSAQRAEGARATHRHSHRSFPSRRSLHQAPRCHRQGTADLRSAQRAEGPRATHRDSRRWFPLGAASTRPHGTTGKGPPTSGQFSRWGPAQRAEGPRATHRRSRRCSPLGAASTRPHGTTGKGPPTSGPLRCFHKSLIVRSVNWPTLKWPAGSGALLVISGASAEAPNPDASPATSASSLSRDRLQMNGRPAASPASRAPSTGVGEAAEIRRGTETHHPSPGGQCLAKRA